MDVMGIAKLSTSIADTGIRQDISLAMLKRTQDLQASAATQLLDAVAPVQNLPEHLGKNVNTTA